MDVIRDLVSILTILFFSTYQLSKLLFSTANFSTKLPYQLVKTVYLVIKLRQSLEIERCTTFRGMKVCNHLRTLKVLNYIFSRIEIDQMLWRGVVSNLLVRKLLALC